MRKYILGAVALAAGALTQQASASSFEATYSLTNTTCSNWLGVVDSCGLRNTGSNGTLTLQVFEYEPTRDGSFITWDLSFTDSYTQEAYANAGYSTSTGYEFFGVPGGANFAALSFSLGYAIGGTSPSAFKPYLTSGIFNAYFDNINESGNINSTATLVSFRDLAAPVPEAEIYTMLLAGLSVLGFVTKRRKTGKKAYQRQAT